MSESRARYGWESDFPAFRDAPPRQVREELQAFVADASPEQRRAWAAAIPPLQGEVEEVLRASSVARRFGAILEYELPMDARRPDVLFLVGAGVMVVELKGKTGPTQADLDQVAAYARDLRAYHAECAGREVMPVLVPTRATGYLGESQGVHVAGPDALDALVLALAERREAPPISRERFLAESAYRPLPTLVEAARELFTAHTLRRVHRAAASTDPAVEEIARIVHQAALTGSRHLVLVTGVPGAGKTLVGLRTVHARYLDDLTESRDGAQPTVPAVFLSGNGPLVEVLQHELRDAGGGGRTFVRAVRDYVARYARSATLVPPEHVVIFDEAQRAHDALQVAEVHGRRGRVTKRAGGRRRAAARSEDAPGPASASHAARSEPELFVEFSGRVPGWSVVVGLIGGGQEIHIGEEGGLAQWRTAVEGQAHGRGQDWTVHAPPAAAPAFAGSAVPLVVRDALNLDTEIRFHLARDLHRWVAGLLGDAGGAGDALGASAPAEHELSALADALEAAGLHLRLTRSLAVARQYLRDRYGADRRARFGLVASSRDRALAALGVPNDWASTRHVRFGPWYGGGDDDPESCRHLTSCVTEFGAQGLELDATLLAWGTDFVRDGGRWSNAGARGYRRGAHVRDPFRLRLNAYRVLLTRGRDGCVAFVPPLPALDETHAYLQASGFRSLDG